MKFYFSILITCFVLNLTAQSTAISYKDKNDKIQLLGEIERTDLEVAPYQTWFDSIYQAYTIDLATIQKLNTHYDKNIQIKIFLGTWCGDSKREVSRFMKIADNSNIDLDNVELFCLDTRKGRYKQGLNGEEKGLNIHRVPTFIFYENNEEIGRIVEYPVSTLEMDVTQIYAGLPSQPNYRLANEIGQLFDEKTMVEVDTFLSQKFKILKRKVNDENELSTYGFVLLEANEIEKAKMVFRLNTKMFPEKGYAFYGLGRAYMVNDEHELATENFMQAAKLGGEYGYASKKMKELVTEIAKE